jgi:nitrate reductase NapAB chaperone NapD
METQVTSHSSNHDTRAYVLIDTEPNMTARVVRNLRRRDDVLMADAVNGPHGVIAVVEGRNASEVATTILMTIRKLDGVRDFTVYTAVPQGTTPAPVSD